MAAITGLWSGPSGGATTTPASNRQETTIRINTDLSNPTFDVGALGSRPMGAIANAYEIVGDAANLDTSAALYESNDDIEVNVIGIGVVQKGSDALWVSQTQLRIELEFSPGDEVLIYSS